MSKVLDSKTDDKEYEGRLYTNVKDNVQQDVSIDVFIKKGYVSEQWYADGRWNERGEGEKHCTTQESIIYGVIIVCKLQRNY